MSELLVRLNPYLVANDELDRQYSLDDFSCAGCGKLMERSEDMVFVTAYPKSSERQDFWFRLHRDCRLPIGLEALIS